MKNKTARNIILLGAVSFFNDLSSEIIIPILPMFITGLGGTGIIVGLVGGFRDSISSILKLFCGYWSDKTGKRKIFVVAGYLSSSIFKLLLSFSRTLPQALIFSGLERTGKGIRTAPRDAIIADSMPAQRGRGFGIHRTLDTSGAILGTASAFLLFWIFGLDFNTMILIASGLAFISLIPLSFVKDEKRVPQDVSLKLGLKELSRPLKIFILISGIFAMANFSYMFFILKAQGVFSGKLLIGGPILLYILLNIFYAGFAIPFGKISDKRGRRAVITSGYALFSITCMGFALFSSLTAFVILFALFGIVFAITDSNQRAFISDLAPEKLKATALGTYHTVTGLAALPGSLIAGVLWEQLSPSSAFIYGSVLSLLSVVLFIVLRKKF